MKNNRKIKLLRNYNNSMQPLKKEECKMDQCLPNSFKEKKKIP